MPQEAQPSPQPPRVEKPGKQHQHDCQEKKAGGDLQYITKPCVICAQEGVGQIREHTRRQEPDELLEDRTE